jgi:DNA-binding transcriptional MerR regulator
MGGTMGEPLRTAEVAKLLGLSTRTLEKWRLKGTGPPFERVSSRAVRYDADALEAWRVERRSTSVERNSDE